MPLRIIVTVLALSFLGGCASTTPVPTRDPYAGVPDDFSVDVTILAAENEPGAHRRTSRYVLYPDGTLLHDDLPGRGPNTLPGFTRRLSSEQMAEIWATVRRLGLADASGADQIQNFRRVRQPTEGHVYLVAITADGDFWNYTRGVAPGEKLDPALSSLLQELATLSWARNDDDDRAVVAPVRYDFGPDPYASYRETGEE